INQREILRSAQDDGARRFFRLSTMLDQMKFLFAFYGCIAAVLAQTASDDSAAVLQAERDGCLAYLRGDGDKIAKFLADDYTLTNSKGEITTAADDIEDAKTGRIHYDV